ncbi:hypothetical protein PR202_ga23753 [Eleusine coracana subsp. coracana]|uniref:Uncharacterized protein n=1 Tax=Eleusine coracana subsp. coracana TaxID=191504 RepID=A0AAV5D7E1_ELECO|nr:hypothetical protein PR202_ga23753 [Eleusine coracana subsp. coracana]
MADNGVVDGGMLETATDGDDSAESLDVKIIAEHEIENKLVDLGGYVFEGDVGDEELYSLKKQPTRSENAANSNEKGKAKASALGLSPLPPRVGLLPGNSAQGGVTCLEWRESAVSRSRPGRVAPDRHPRAALWTARGGLFRGVPLRPAEQTCAPPRRNDRLCGNVMRASRGDARASAVLTQELAIKVKEREEEIAQLRKHLADYSAKAFDQQQQDLIDAASKALSYRQDIIEENIRLTYALQTAQQERSTFISSLLPLLSEYDSLHPSVPDAQSIVSNLKVLFKHLQEQLLVTENFEVALFANLDGAGEIKGVTVPDYSMAYRIV